jgi:hypothetical protein
MTAKGHLWLLLRSGYEWRGCPQAVSRESHRTRNKNKQTNRRLTVIVGMRVRPSKTNKQSELKTETKRMSMYVYECDVR